jgi:hypothetical protein
MILEERDYHIVPGRMAEFLATYEKLGVAIQTEILGGFVGHFVCDMRISPSVRRGAPACSLTLDGRPISKRSRA